MRNQRRGTEEQEALQRWKSLQGLEHEPPTGTRIYLSQRLLFSLTTSYYTCAWEKHSKTQSQFFISSFSLSFCFLLLIYVFNPCSSVIQLILRSIIFLLFTSFLPVNHTFSPCYFVFSWPLIIFPSSACCPLRSHPPERKKPGRVGWRSTPSQLIRVSPKWSPVHLTSINPTDTTESTSRHAALHLSHEMGNHHVAAHVLLTSLLNDLHLNMWPFFQICPGHRRQWSLCFPHGCVYLLPPLSGHQSLLGLLPGDSLRGRTDRLSSCERDMCPPQ